MKIVLREDESGVSEVVGTILILAMTVVLFSTIILWVANIPTPVAQTRVDILASLNIVYGSNGQEAGDWINMTHQGGEPMLATATGIYITDSKASGGTNTYSLHLALMKTYNGSVKYGMLDGSGASWNVGQRFSYFSSLFRSSDQITVTIVDLSRSLVLWTSTLSPPAGTRPPVFLNTWVSQKAYGTPITPVTGTGFYVLAQVMSPDNRVTSVNATLTYYYGQPSAQNCAVQKPMYDNGANGDAATSDGVYTLFDNSCTGDAVSGMDGSLILFDATDSNGHVTTTRMVMHVLPGSGSHGPFGNDTFSGRPPNLLWNGNQGYNFFNASEWDVYHYSAEPTRTFKPNETVVMVVGSLTLQNVFGVNQFNLLDPFQSPSRDVVYVAQNPTQSVGPASLPSTTSAFSFFDFVNGYYIYTYRFKLNDPTDNRVLTNFYLNPPLRPNYYYFANYPLSVLLTDSANDRFTTMDSINITSSTGDMRKFPSIQTYSDPLFSKKASRFNSTATVYVQLNMYTVNLNNSGEINGQVLFGNIMITDFSGGHELNRAPTTVSGSSIYSNLPICPPQGPCSSSKIAIWSDAATTSYRFSINLARVNQDPWIAGLQNYALAVSSVKDADESYTSVSGLITVQAPLYKMDILTGNGPATNNAWGTKNYAYFYQDYNGFDQWKVLRVDYCNAGTSISGVSGTGSTCPAPTNVAVAYGDFWHDGTLGAAESFWSRNDRPPYTVQLYRRTVDATGAVVYLPVAPFPFTTPTACTAIAAGDVTGNGLPSIICGGDNGWVWYYPNNGNWSATGQPGVPVYVDQPSPGHQINSIVVGDFNGDGWNDIAVGGAGGTLLWYPNLGFGRFQNPGGISDNWVATQDQTVGGALTQGTYLNTFVQDGVSEQITEGTQSIGRQFGGLTNSYFNATVVPWVNVTLSGKETGVWSSSNGNPGGYAQITDKKPTANGLVAGYWMQPFTVAGSPTFTIPLSLDYQVSSYGAGPTGAVTFYAFVDGSANAPPTSPTCSTGSSGSCWSSGQITANKPWTAATFSFTGRVPAPGTYYLKIAMYATYISGTADTVGGFDNVFLNWTSTAGIAYGMEQYWKLQTLPTRPGTTFTFNLNAGLSSTQPGFTTSTAETIQFAYSTNVGNNPPTTGTYTVMPTVSVTGAMGPYTFILNATTVVGQTLWIRALDVNRTVGEVGPLTLFVDLLNVNANTQSASSVSLTADGSTVAMIDAQDANADGYSDLVVGTANGNVYRYHGAGGGLISDGRWYTAGSPIVGVKWGNFTYTSGPGPHWLGIALAFGTTVRIISGSVANSLIFPQTLLSPGFSWPAPPFTPTTITAFAVGDINGDGWDDILVGTGTGQIVLWENLGQSASWTYAVQVDNVGAPIYSLALGASTNSQYMGR